MSKIAYDGNVGDLVKALVGDIKATSITLWIAVGEAVKVEVQHFIDIDKAADITKELEKITEEYILVKREVPKDSKDAS